MKGDMALPLTPDGVTATWLTEALQHTYPGTKTRALEIVEVITGTSTKIRIKADCTGPLSLPADLIVKGGFEQHSPPMAAMYQREARFYRDVVPFIPINAPRSFYAGSDPQSHQSIVVMEDLRARNVHFCDALETEDFETVASRLNAMAAFHAATWNSPGFAPGGRFDWITGRFEGFGRSHNERYLTPETWRRMVRTPRGAAISTRFHDPEWMIGAMNKLGDLHRASPVQSLLHGDTHSGNLYIDADGTPGFLDAQVVRSPWHLDVTKYIICALDHADRRQWEVPLLQYYLDCLSNHGITPPSFAHAWECHKQEITYGLVMFTINETAFQPESVNTAYTARFNSAAIDHDVWTLMR